MSRPDRLVSAAGWIARLRGDLLCAAVALVITVTVGVLVLSVVPR